LILAEAAREVMGWVEAEAGCGTDKAGVESVPYIVAKVEVEDIET